MSVENVIKDVLAERRRQDEKWGKQSHPDGTGDSVWSGVASILRDRCDAAFSGGAGTWQDILIEEVAEAFAEADPVRLRKELVQVAAVAMQWIEAIDRRVVHVIATGEQVKAAADEILEQYAGAFDALKDR